MPALANIVVKKYDGTTDVTYTATAASAGDKSPAVWRNDSVGTALGHRPEFRLTTRSNGIGSARRADFSYSWPSLATGSDGKINIIGRVNLSGSVIVPQDILLTDVNEACYQGCNLLAATLIKQSIRDGFAPT